MAATVFSLWLFLSPPAWSQPGAMDRDAQALKWITLSAKEGKAQARETLAVKYYFGDGVPQDYAVALKWLRGALDAGSSLARNCFANIVLDGGGAFSTIEKLRWLRLGVAKGNLRAMEVLGEKLFKGEDLPANPEEALRYLTPAAEKGSARAQYLVGLAYARGAGVGENDQAAVEWLRNAVEQDFPDAQQALGEMYAEGRGVPADDGIAVKLLRQAARQGNEQARSQLWTLQQQGRVEPETTREGREWLVAAATAGNPEAQTRYGDFWFQRKETSLYLNEYSCYRMAAFWYWNAARQGEPEAQYKLAQMLLRGEGVGTSLEQAYVWSGLAARQNIRNAADFEKSLLPRMSTEQAAHAKKALEKTAAREPAQGRSGKLYLPSLAD